MAQLNVETRPASNSRIHTFSRCGVTPSSAAIAEGAPPQSVAMSSIRSPSTRCCAAHSSARRSARGEEQVSPLATCPSSCAMAHTRVTGSSPARTTIVREPAWKHALYRASSLPVSTSSTPCSSSSACRRSSIRDMVNSFLGRGRLVCIRGVGGFAVEGF